MSREADNITVRPGTDADIPAVIELMKLSLGEGNVPRTSEFWRWKHRANPFGSSPMWLAHAGDQLVGVRLFLRWQLNARARRYSALRAVDTATHPDFQGKGIFKRLTLRLVEAEHTAGTNLIFNTPNDKSRPGYLKMGWSAVGRLSLWIRPRRPVRLLRAALATPEPARDETAIGSGLPADAFAGLADDAAVDQRLGYRTALTTTYLDWRYRPPGIDYTLEREGGVGIVFRLRRRGALRELRICDLLLAGDVRDKLLGLRRCIARAVERTEPDYLVMAFRPEPVEIALASMLGFVPAPRIGPVLTVRPLELPAAAPEPRRLLSWSTSIGDLELF